MAARRKLPDIDAFGAMLDRAFPAGPLSDVSVNPEPEFETVILAPVSTPTPVSLSVPPSVADFLNEQKTKNSVKVNIPSGNPAKKQTNKPVNYPTIDQTNDPDKQLDTNPDNKPAYYPGNQKDIQQTIKTDNYQAYKPASKPDSQPADNPAISGHPVNHPDRKPVTNQANNKDNYPDNGPGNESVYYPDNSSTTEGANSQVSKPVFYPVNTVDPELWYPFTEKQGKILLYLIQAGGITKREHISTDTGVNIATVKHTLRVLAHEGYINNIQLYTNHSFRGFSYGVNRTMCAEFTERLTGQTIDCPDNQPVNYPANRMARYPARKAVNYPVRKPTYYPINEPDNSPDASFSSSRKELKLTTTENSATEDLLKDPELSYWKEKGINNRKIRDWSEEFQMPIDQVIQSLKYCRYEMVILDQEVEKQISNPMNWFYKIMQRSGVYPKPTNYKSLAEIRAEQMEQAARDLAEARERQVAAEHELAFQKILESPTCEEYQILLQQVSEFAREMGGKALETAMREAFEDN